MEDEMIGPELGTILSKDSPTLLGSKAKVKSHAMGHVTPISHRPIAYSRLHALVAAQQGKQSHGHSITS
ncbi:hypothetical protein T265_01034 [Opisthorchis viverrini]|uniref:Uncharacterized protein n=1 Tax=Opisthorchis viverrini TaxID=6198 RepID=A0A075A0Q1_OPIVI|nr:hypothetical protein T265_01034 [Opisthorchis viverrini]KER32941.1 hypothetical protein T265_01034 [Opisthorchis viverrini]